MFITAVYAIFLIEFFLLIVFLDMLARHLFTFLVGQNTGKKMLPYIYIFCYTYQCIEKILSSK